LVAPRKVLMLGGDYMEDYEAAVPLYALAALGIAVDCAAPGKRPATPASPPSTTSSASRYVTSRTYYS
jgi:putative intracellular protease/amidase